MSTKIVPDPSSFIPPRKPYPHCSGPAVLAADLLACNVND
jgi:hypothetical protein